MSTWPTAHESYPDQSSMEAPGVKLATIDDGGPHTQLLGRMGHLLETVQGQVWQTYPSVLHGGTGFSLGSTGSFQSVYAASGLRVYAHAIARFGGSGINAGNDLYTITVPSGYEPDVTVHNLMGTGLIVDWSEGQGLTEFGHRMTVPAWLAGPNTVVSALPPVRRFHTGRALLPAGSSSVDVQHGLGVAPQQGNIIITPTVSPAVAGASNTTVVTSVGPPAVTATIAGNIIWYVDENSVDANKFTVHATKQDGSNIGGFGWGFNWRAEISGPSSYVQHDTMPWEAGDYIRWDIAYRRSAF